MNNRDALERATAAVIGKLTENRGSVERRTAKESGNYLKREGEGRARPVSDRQKVVRSNLGGVYSSWRVMGGTCGRVNR